MTALDDIREWTKKVLNERLGPPGPVALLDFPLHGNAGDSLIYLGERAYLRELGYDVRHITDQSHYQADRLRRAHPEGPILIHGGGNFGDRYPTYQPHREQVAADFPDRLIVQLPQSIDYADPARAAATHDALRNHANFTLIVREKPSLALAEKLFPDLETSYCPDLAFGVGPQEVDQKLTEYDVVWLLRTDSESVPRELDLPSDSLVVDWELSPGDRLVWYAWELPARLGKRMPSVRIGTDLVHRQAYDRLANINVRRAIKTLSRGRLLVTDRLHAAVLGGLLGMTVIALDNNYGKVSSIYYDYLGRLPNVKFADTVEGLHNELRAAL